MGWNVSHGTDRNGEFRRSYTTMGNLAQQLPPVLSARDWSSIAYLFNHRDANPFTVPAAEAGRVATVLHRAADHRLMPADWGQDARLLAAAAARAARAREPWHWS